MSRFSLSPLSRVPSPLNLWDEDDFFSFKDFTPGGLEIKEGEKEVTVRANVAGVPADNIEVTFDKGVLWIQAKAEEKQENKGEKYYSRALWNYSYRLNVPGQLDVQKEPVLSLKDGVLAVVFTKEEVKAPKKLKINS
jgi:HSP20 family protein